MSQQQPDFDPWTNSDQNLWGGGNALAVALARADVLARARIPRRSDFGSNDTSSPMSYRSRPLSTCKKNGDYFNGDFDATAFTVNINNILIK